MKALSRVEGEGRLYVRVDGDTVEHVELNIYEPPRFFEAFLRGRAAMEVLAVVIAGDLERLPVDAELAVAQAVRVATDGAAEVGVVVDVTIDVIVAQGDLADFSPAVGYADGGEGGSVFTDRHAHATPVIQDM